MAKIPCPRCKGTGIEWVMIGPEPEKDCCSWCDGEGKVEESEGKDAKRVACKDNG